MFTKFLEQACQIVAEHKAQYHGHYIMFGGGSTTSSTNTTPWSGQTAFLSGTNNANLAAPTSTQQNPPSVFNSAAQLYENSGDYPQYYANSTVTPFNSMETGSINGLYNTGMNGTGALNAANTDVQNILSGNPAMNQSIAASVVPGLESQFTQGNSMNNPAAVYAVSNGLSNALLQNQLSAAGTAQNLYNTQLGGQQAALTAGQAQQTQDQSALTDQVNRWNYNQQLPFNMLNQYANTVNGQYGSTGSTTQPNQSFLGSLLSDVRLKKDVKKIGSYKNGLPKYEFSYLWGQKAVGAMAHEVENLLPQAIGNILGFKTVNYALVGE